MNVIKNIDKELRNGVESLSETSGDHEHCSTYWNILLIQSAIVPPKQSRTSRNISYLCNFICQESAL